MAEGFGRFLPGEFAHKMRIAKGELLETLDHVNRGRERNYLDDREHSDMVVLANRAIGASTNLVKYLERAANARKQRPPRHRS